MKWFEFRWYGLIATILGSWTCWIILMYYYWKSCAISGLDGIFVFLVIVQCIGLYLFVVAVTNGFTSIFYIYDNIEKRTIGYIAKAAATIDSHDNKGARGRIVMRQCNISCHDWINKIFFNNNWLMQWMQQYVNCHIVWVYLKNEKYKCCLPMDLLKIIFQYAVTVNVSTASASDRDGNNGLIYNFDQSDLKLTYHCKRYRR